jgi:hypothetical protein
MGGIIGDPLFFERAEKIAYNSIAGAANKAMTAHNYLSQPNEMQV